ncbi:hypothetical protein T4D_3627 [Trichinella pseudospiralis]|uniref:Uncharacterized protein n=1 Tax=Trichinella pseudospiralis TaxID=6337 RepID=A0A0V1G090_TRIPS|nr:hypothetical protein T4D_3627 [Trichinella pseudospiralis]
MNWILKIFVIFSLCSTLYADKAYFEIDDDDDDDVELLVQQHVMNMNSGGTQVMLVSLDDVKARVKGRSVVYDVTFTVEEKQCEGVVCSIEEKVCQGDLSHATYNSFIVCE